MNEKDLLNAIKTNKLPGKIFPVEEYNEIWDTPLTLAAILKSVEAVKLLLANSVDINKTDSENNTALIIASDNGSYEIVKILLEHGARKDIKNKEGYTAADRVMASDSHIIKLLKEKA